MDKAQYAEATVILEKLANGIHPLDNHNLDESHFLNDPRVIRPLFNLLTYLTKSKSRVKPSRFLITDDILNNLSFPDRPIGINDFCTQVNDQLDSGISKKLTGKMIYTKLKELGILTEEIHEEGSKRTVTNEVSEGYGMTTIDRNFRGRDYKQIVFDATAIELLKKIVREF